MDQIRLSIFLLQAKLDYAQKKGAFRSEYFYNKEWNHVYFDQRVHERQVAAVPYGCLSSGGCRRR